MPSVCERSERPASLSGRLCLGRSGEAGDVGVRRVIAVGIPCELLRALREIARQSFNQLPPTVVVSNEAFSGQRGVGQSSKALLHGDRSPLRAALGNEEGGAPFGNLVCLSNFEPAFDSQAGAVLQSLCESAVSDA